MQKRAMNYLLFYLIKGLVNDVQTSLQRDDFITSANKSKSNSNFNKIWKQKTI